MLLINASAGPSTIHGIGLIAREVIPAGTVVWELRQEFDVVLTPEQWDQLSPPAREQVRRFVYVDVQTGRHVLCSDDAKFMNHAAVPNTRTEGPRTWTLREISPGEELTCDYAEFDAATRARETE